MRNRCGTKTGATHLFISHLFIFGARSAGGFAKRDMDALGKIAFLASGDWISFSPFD
jgi:hypothetical protein